MANSTPTFAVASHSKIQSYIEQKILTFPSYVFCKDTNTMVFVDKNLQIQDIKGFNQVSIIEINENESLPTENIQGNTFYLHNGIGYLLINDKLVPVFKNIDDSTGSISSYDELENLPIENKYGNLNSPIVLADLEVGSYSVYGQYRISGSMETVYLSPKNVMVLVETDETNKYITRFGARNICVYTVNLETQETVVDEYATQSWVMAQGYATENYVNKAIEDLYNRIAEEALVSITKVSQLENDMGYLTADDLNEVSDIEIANLFLI